MDKPKKIKIPEPLKLAAKPFRITTRELQTLALLAVGEPWKSIAEQMSISIQTVRFHASNICRKTATHSTFAAISKILLKLENRN